MENALNVSLTIVLVMVGVIDNTFNTWLTRELVVLAVIPNILEDCKLLTRDAVRDAA